jgi:polar amino acid transport system ATP-binding protein
MIRLQDVSKFQGGRAVLQNITLDVPAGQTVGIIGPSGSGKSSLLRLVMCLDQPDRGQIEIAGESPWVREVNARPRPATPAERRQVRGRVGMVFQQFNLFPHMTVLRNVTEAPLHVLGLSALEAGSRAREYLQMVGLEDRMDAYPRQLSGGQKQRVAIARALAMRPQIMLFDEVTSALDPELVGGILTIMQSLASQRTMTLLIVTHHMAFAERCSDRILFMDGGRILEDAPPPQFFRAPQHPRAQHFLDALIG